MTERSAAPYPAVILGELRLWLLAGLLLCGCGTRAESRDAMCDPEKPHAYEKKPLFGSCHRIRTNESATDPATGATEHNIHREYFCCN